MTGQVAMAIDGEWRAGMIEADAPDLNFGVAPFPVPDDQADSYGKGYITGTIVGIASTSQKQNAAWRFVQFLTTDTKAVVDFANAIHNVPSTLGALASPDVSQDPAMQTFIGIASNPGQQHDAGQPERRRLPAHAAGRRLRLRVGQAGRPAGRAGARRRSRSTPTSTRASERAPVTESKTQSQ